MSDSLISSSDLKEKNIGSIEKNPVELKNTKFEPSVIPNKNPENVQDIPKKVKVELPSPLIVEKKEDSKVASPVSPAEINESERIASLNEANKKDDYIEAEASL